MIQSSITIQYEPRCEKTGFCMCENKDADQLRGDREADLSAFVFAIRIVQSLFYLNPKFQASSHLLWLYSPVCVGPGRKPRRPVFSQRGSYMSSHFSWEELFTRLTLGRVRTSNVSLAKINYHRNYDKIFAFSHIKEKC